MYKVAFTSRKEKNELSIFFLFSTFTAVTETENIFSDVNLYILKIIINNNNQIYKFIR
jgi:hypothetical protein